MKKQLVLIPLIGVTLSGCSMINETIATLEANRDAIDMSTWAIQENAQAIEESNRSIAENRRQLDEINKTLKKAAQS